MGKNLYPKGKEEKVKELIKKGYITNGDDLYQWFIDNDEEQGDNLVSETLFDTSEQMFLEDNDGEPTIEAYISGELIYENKK